MSAVFGEKELKTDYPVTSGLTAETTKQKGREMWLLPTEKSIVLKRNKTGLK